ncbi:MAG: hypothetical protein LBU89_10915 [Fibromonadaceae bacterium]|jgi:hypothetical protein|nr:hypothetical protein [Fibromonadaceae bacterium]
MIKQAMVKSIFKPEIPENQKIFLQDLSESLQGLMHPQVFKQDDGGVLEIMAFGPFVLLRYEGSAREVLLPFQPDGNMPMLGGGMIMGNKIVFDTGDWKISCGWCISCGSKFRKGGG